jgi:RNAse (barnase) inhibitor barstar
VTELPEAFQRIDDPRACAAEARRAGKLVVWVPRGVRSKEKLLRLLSQALRFPNYFGGNWDALEECLHDLHWLPEKINIAIVHEQWPFGEGENRQIYGDILQAVSQGRGDGRKIEVVVRKS